MAITGIIDVIEPVSLRADSAVGLPVAESPTTSTTPTTPTTTNAAPLHWYAAVVKNRSEKRISDDLAKAGIETFVPVQSVARKQRDGRPKMTRRVVIPAMLFVRCTEQRRRKEVVWHPLVHRFLTDRAASESRTVARIPDAEIGTLKFMLGQSDIPVGFIGAGEGHRYSRADRVVVIRGSLKGLEGEVVGMKPGQTQLIVRLSTLGCATLTIPATDLMPR